ncbi:TerD family protein [Streptomyces sp. NPDC048057]|uniref:TerD family protein n=1 Tax=Streptomyces sp. NPDC048057 TaxID=3155628 RepID=UPI0033E5DB54
MADLIKGANSFVPTVALRVGVQRGLDTSALLLAAGGRVRGDADMVFYGQQVHPSGAVRHLGPHTGTDWLHVDLPQVEDAVERVVIVASADGGTIGDVPEPAVEAYAPDGTVVVRYVVTDASTETAFVFGEFYRRAGGWKFRAVGQGYADGLAGLATDFGIDVAEDDAENGAGAGAAPAVAPGPPPFKVPAPPVQPAMPPEFQAPAPPPAPLSAQPLPTQPPSAQPLAAQPQSYRPMPPPPPPAFPFPPMQPMQPVQPMAIPAPAPAPVPVPAPAVPDWTFGPVFEPFVYEGRGDQVVSAPRTIPTGPVMVEFDLTRCRDQYAYAYSLDKWNKDDDLLLNTNLDNTCHRALAKVPKVRRLRMNVHASGAWTLRVLPLVAARRLQGTLEGRGDEVVLYTGPISDLRFESRGEGHVYMYGYEVDGRTEVPEDDSLLLVNDNDDVNTSTPLPAGPLLLKLVAEGSWTMRADPVD